MLTVPQIEALRRPTRSFTNRSSGGGCVARARIRAGASTTRSPTARITPVSPTGALTAGNVDPSKSGVLMKGSVPPTWSGAFTYVSTTSSITWSWSGLTIYRADGTTTRRPERLARRHRTHPGTTYYFYPYWNDAASAIGWVAGGTGSPASAQTAKTNLAAQQQALQGLIPLSQGAIVAATTTRHGRRLRRRQRKLFRAGTVVLTKERGTVDIETCKVASICAARSPAAGEGMDAHRAHRSARRGHFIRLHFSNAESLDVTPHHIFTLADGSPMRAERLCLSDILVGRFGRVTLKRIEAIVYLTSAVSFERITNPFPVRRFPLTFGERFNSPEDAIDMQTISYTLNRSANDGN